MEKFSKTNKHSKKSRKRVTFRQPSKLNVPSSPFVNLASEPQKPSSNVTQESSTIQHETTTDSTVLTAVGSSPRNRSTANSGQGLQPHGNMDQKRTSSNKYYTIHASAPTTTTTTDSSTANVLPNYIKDKFISVVDRLDAQVDKFRQDAFKLVKKRDFLLTCIDLLKSDEQQETMPCDQRDRVSRYYKRLNKVFLQVSTIRDNSQERSLEQVNAQINAMIGMSDPKLSFTRCQVYLNTFDNIKNGSKTDNGLIDRNFESALLGCTIDDQREVRTRLEALLDYMKTHNT